MHTFFGGSLLNIFLAITDGNVSLKAPFEEVLKYFLYHTATRLMVLIGSLWIIFENINVPETNQLAILLVTLFAIIFYKPIKKRVQRKKAEQKEKELEHFIKVVEKIAKEINKNDKNDLNL